MPARSPRRILGRLVFGCAGLLAACVNTSGDPLTPSAIARTYCVEHQPADRRDFHVQVAESMRAEGLDARAAPAGECPGDDDYRVTYQDRIAWDLRLFLAKFTIFVEDPATGEIVAFGESNQDSIGAMGSSHRGVVDRAVRELVGRGG